MVEPLLNRVELSEGSWELRHTVDDAFQHHFRFVDHNDVVVAAFAGWNAVPVRGVTLVGTCTDVRVRANLTTLLGMSRARPALSLGRSAAGTSHLVGCVGERFGMCVGGGGK